MSATPRTDAEVEHASNVALYICTGKHGYTEAQNAMVVNAEFARALEMEIAALRRGEFICKKCGIRKDADDSNQPCCF